VGVVLCEFKNLICVTFVFFAFTDHFATNPLSEFCFVHLNLTSVVRHHEVYRKLLSCNEVHNYCSYYEGFSAVLYWPTYSAETCNCIPTDLLGEI